VDKGLGVPQLELIEGESAPEMTLDIEGTPCRLANQEIKNSTFDDADSEADSVLVLGE
jgi:hypothetical protein